MRERASLDPFFCCCRCSEVHILLCEGTGEHWVKGLPPHVHSSNRYITRYVDTR